MPQLSTDLNEIIHLIRKNKGLPPVDSLDPDLRLREDLGLDSLDLAELTVRLERACGVDVFADGLVYTLGEVQSKLPDR